MTRGSIREYTEVVLGRYLKSKRKENGRALDEFVQVTDYHCKTAIRLLNRNNSHMFEISISNSRLRSSLLGICRHYKDYGVDISVHPARGRNSFG
ncbi:MAG: hypothetical protein NTZ04_04910 [Chloroflexi bacterium]|nr:hypothetical protein [Chloroflexota bacterium]